MKAPRRADGKRRQLSRKVRVQESAPTGAVSHKRKVREAAFASAAKKDLQEQSQAAEEPHGAPGDTTASGAPIASEPTALFQKDSSFAKLGLARWLVEGCEKLGMVYPTEIQAMCIPPVLAGKQVIGNSKTGSGKTACFCLPILHQLSKDPYGIFALVLLPVRELTFQVSENFRALGKGINVEVFEVIGGQDMQYQARMIASRKHVITATPGRLADLLRGEPGLSKAFGNLRVLVLDEADRLLTQSFEEELEDMLPRLPKTRQTLLFSATITGSIEKLRSRLQTDGRELMLLDANPTDESLETLTQEYVFVPEIVQICYVHHLLRDHFANDSCILFAPTLMLCQLLMTTLELLGLLVTGLHSLQSQQRRRACLNNFRAGRSRILVATDVASRGLDIPKVSVVMNMGLPMTADSYVHRAGRTGRAGRPGLVISVMCERDVAKVQAIEERIGMQLKLRPTVEEDALKLMSKTTKAQQKAELLLSEAGFHDRVQERRESDKKRLKERENAGHVAVAIETPRGTRSGKRQKKTRGLPS
mmetsp:Transcript_46650/g.107787  ORF Transcript_46650/g.107787 Transcript_46650/m.107787 type:complete len:534 (+) Transcript_46650:26-1627(+)